MTLAVLVLRVAVGAVFIWAGALKIGHADVFAAQITAFGIVPHALIAPLALLLPVFEIVLGGYLIAGLYTRVAAVIAAIQLAIFAAAIASAVMRGLSLSCGCFGPGDKTVTSWPEVVRDVAVAAVAVFVAWQAPGMLALDRRIGNVK
ncbi:MAG: MauE/DoxX family redox-associated membrane protein [Candidatus Velthaea sp.]